MWFGFLLVKIKHWWCRWVSRPTKYHIKPHEINSVAYAIAIWLQWVCRMTSMYNMASHLIFLNLSIFESLDRQWTNGSSYADFPWCYTPVSLFSYKERGYVVWATPQVRLLKSHPPRFEIWWFKNFTSSKLFHGSYNIPTSGFVLNNNWQMNYSAQDINLVHYNSDWGNIFLWILSERLWFLLLIFSKPCFLIAIILFYE